MTPEQMMWAVAAGVMIGGFLLGTVRASVELIWSGNGFGWLSLIGSVIAATWIIDAKVFGHVWGHS